VSARELPWLDAVRALAGAHVAARRVRWQERGRTPTVHDAIDEVITGDTLAVPIDDACAALDADARWCHLRETLDVDARDVQWLALLAACELDPRLTRVLGYLDDSAVPAPPTPAVGAVLWGWPLGTAIGPASSAAQWRLAQPIVDDDWHATTPWHVDPEIAAYVAGAPGWLGFRNGVAIPEIAHLDCLHPELLREMHATAAAVVTDARAGIEVELVGNRGTGRRTLLAQLARAFGSNAAWLNPAAGGRGLRAARLLDAIPIWCADDDADAGPIGVDATPGALTMVARTMPASAPPDDIVRISWTMPATGPARRRRLWSAATAHDAPRVVADWELTPADIRVGAASAAAGTEVAARVIRGRLRATTLESMTALACPYEWDDLIVGERVKAQLERLRNQVLLKTDVLDHWEFRRLCPSAAGVTALFAGPSGTGKTMAAQVLARALELDLYRVDLAEVVNKYIGETEKRLSAVFAECERSNVMVLFDEADALFGQRTRVQDAHDRYANIEIDYLLQRLDTFRGIAILATNRKSDLDAAFLRRLRVVVDFVAPAYPERVRLWEHALPAHTSSGEPITADLDVPWLAEYLELSGAEINAIALAAAFDAREANQLVRTEHVVEASRRELGKRGSVLRTEPVAAVAQ
jgi:hypothetical protein